MAAADEIRAQTALADEKRAAGEALDQLVRAAEIWREKLIVAEDTPDRVEMVLAAIRSKAPTAGLYDRYVEWGWDTRYAHGKEFGHPEIEVCRFAQKLLAEALEAEGFEVEDRGEGHRWPAINADGYTVGTYQGAYGGLKVSW